jgi:hypothetical protein
MVARPRNRPPHSHAASENLKSVVRVVQTGPPAPDLVRAARVLLIPTLILIVVRREPYLAEEASFGSGRQSQQ